MNKTKEVRKLTIIMNLIRKSWIVAFLTLRNSETAADGYMFFNICFVLFTYRDNNYIIGTNIAQFKRN